PQFPIRLATNRSVDERIRRAAMRGIATYMLAGILVVMALDLVAPLAGVGVSAATLPEPVQSVNRTNKADRVPLPATTVGERQSTDKTPVMLTGCEPVFSPLSASARANFAGRCIA
ncbi:MAG: hypothetical protein ABI830_10340, partial [Pseudolabrys sp.]